ncbi:MAG: antibiotic transport system ATP-binding protein [Candidatus Berkelbacteria bacterium Athens1014_28]|uniref:Antibiotic transport system ATP-binding protein n=1 Tax=Candidatus Berkelbacteria bacterium Athens1014_28 TaxID=2017145 RepID=A0A554LPZ1_9BACT|nr:MAG: antibiotic transport system ATP-binding protein [Candidatus Berkelbacteria bacterium Athens1014_28]
MPVIEIKKLKKYFGKVKAVDGIDISVEAGEIYGFLGPNGAGKTTAIRCMLDFLRPNSGEVKIFAKNVRENSAELKKEIGYLSGNVRLYDSWSGEDHINFVESFGGKNNIAKELSKNLNFDPKMKFRYLSSGNKQKLGLILALMREPKLLILDEPTLALDPLLQNSVHEILLEAQKKGTTIFISSHNLSEVDRICGKVGIIKDGKIIASEDIHSLKEKRLHQITVYFSDGAKPANFKMPEVERIEEIKDGMVLRTRGDINLVLKEIVKYPIHDIEISHASLEEIFLEFYQK